MKEVGPALEPRAPAPPLSRASSPLNLSKALLSSSSPSPACVTKRRRCLAWSNAMTESKIPNHASGSPTGSGFVAGQALEAPHGVVARVADGARP